MGKIKGFLFAVRHREILMTDLGLRCCQGWPGSFICAWHYALLAFRANSLDHEADGMRQEALWQRYLRHTYVVQAEGSLA